MDDDKLSEWNMAKATLLRMDGCLQNCNEYDRTHNGIEWFRELKLLYKEIYPEIKKDEREKAENYIGRAIEEMDKLNEYPDESKPSITPRLRFTLEQLEMLLRDLMGKHKLYMAREKGWQSEL